jgi:hypothetical protein
LVLIYEMGKLEALLVSAELFRKDAESVPLWFSTYTAPDTVFATMIAKDEWTRDDAILTCAHNAHILPTWTVGGTAVVAAAGVTEMEFMGAWMAHCPYFAGQRATATCRWHCSALNSSALRPTHCRRPS